MSGAGSPQPEKKPPAKRGRKSKAQKELEAREQAEREAALKRERGLEESEDEDNKPQQLTRSAVKRERLDTESPMKSSGGPAPAPQPVAQPAAQTVLGPPPPPAAVPPAQRERKERQRLQRRGLFSKDLPSMMYAFGDVPDPLPESVTVLEDILTQYLSDLCKDAAVHSTNAKKLKLDDLRFALRKPAQAKQLARVEELLIMQDDINRARKNFNVLNGAEGA